MQKATSSKSSAKVSSISQRFSYALIGVITLVLIIFAAIVIIVDINKIETELELETRLDNAIEFAKNSLATPLWNLDYAVVNDFVEALFLDESIVYTKISWKNQILSEKKRTGFELPDIEPGMPSTLWKSSQFIAKLSDIHFRENKVSTILIVMSRESVKKQAIFQIYGVIALSILIIVAIWLTSIFITKKSISSPLSAFTHPP